MPVIPFSDKTGQNGSYRCILDPKVDEAKNIRLQVCRHMGLYAHLTDRILLVLWGKVP